MLKPDLVITIPSSVYEVTEVKVTVQTIPVINVTSGTITMTQNKKD